MPHSFTPVFSAKTIVTRSYNDTHTQVYFHWNKRQQALLLYQMSLFFHKHQYKCKIIWRVVRKHNWESPNLSPFLVQNSYTIWYQGCECMLLPVDMKKDILEWTFNTALDPPHAHYIILAIVFHINNLGL